MTDDPAAALSGDERRAAAEAGIAVYAGRLILDARPPVTDAVLAAVAEHCAGPLPAPLADLWRISFGGSLHYDLRAEFGENEVALSLRELFYPDSDDYQDLWGWIEHERELIGGARLSYLPFGGFEYLDRVYVGTADGPGHGTVVWWQQGLPAGWELIEGDRAAPLAADLPALFDRLVLERDPWESDDGGTELREAVEELGQSDDPRARAAADKLRRLVQQTVLDWRSALRDGTIAGQRRLRRLALDRAAAGDDLGLMRELVARGCDPAEPVRNGLTPIDIALAGRGLAVATWLLERQVPVGNTLRVGAHAVDLGLAGELLRRGATVDASAVAAAAKNPDVAVVELLARALPPESDRPQWLIRRLRESAAVAGEGQRSTVLNRIADALTAAPPAA
ncbi:SMI1/KNR4 family protein [Actinoplanes sp. NPDC048988]|uniref:SMI1/KNR4 family protein n=1 Tax=Actinoplanes sp. NPDC048988 TaxID=3363901 RepID=UPI003723D788